MVQRHDSLLELVAVLPIHVVTVVSTAVFLRHTFPKEVALVALEPIEFADGANPWIVVRSSTVGLTRNQLYSWIHR